jgi:hypothetical protein
MKNKILNLIVRLLVVPFIMVIYLIARIRDTFTVGYLFLKHGGEFLIYQKNINPKSIRDALEEYMEKRNISS